MEPIELCAWHESGKILYAYQGSYTCDGVELSEADAGGGKSRLNGGEDTPYIQAILSGKTQAILLENPGRAEEVAKKLMKIYCAGSCVRIFRENNGHLDAQTEIDIPGQDLKQLELVQQFLFRQVKGHPEDYLNQVMARVFHEIRAEETMKPIESLVKQLLKQENQPFNRFNIEDALMAGGFPIQKQKTGNNFGFNLQEDKSPQKLPVSADEHPLDQALKKFLLLVKNDLSEEELQASIAHLKNLFKNFGNS